MPTWVFLVTGGVALAVVLALVSFAVIQKRHELNAANGDLQVVEYQSPSDTGQDPFTTVADVQGSKVVRFTPSSGTTNPNSSEPFGGSGSLHVCDREKLVDFLLSHPRQRQVWADVESIDDDEDSVSRYIRSLTPVTLTFDTRVTNHMYLNGKAIPFQSILAAGTAVLVDKYGRPVVRCKCGNPLLPPKNYPRINCHHCPPHYKPPKWCRWRIYDPWYPYPPEWLPPEWRDPYPKYYPKPEPWVYKKGKYCYVRYPDPPEVEYPPRWYPPSTYNKPNYYRKPSPSPTPEETDKHKKSDDSSHSPDDAFLIPDDNGDHQHSQPDEDEPQP